MFFSPHPDDHISCAGTIIKLKQKGYKVFEVLYTNGETGGQIGKVKVNQKKLVEIRNEEFEKASKLLGTKKYFKMNQPTNGLEYSRELFFDLIKIIRECRPSLALIPHPSDYHRDHKQASVISYDAIKASDNSFALHLGDRYRVPVTLYYRGLNPLDNVDMLVDVSAQHEDVQEIVKAYSTQITPRLQQYTESLPNLAGYYMRVEYAEEFEIPKNMPMFPSEVLADLV